MPLADVFVWTAQKCSIFEQGMKERLVLKNEEGGKHEEN